MTTKMIRKVSRLLKLQNLKHHSVQLCHIDKIHGTECVHRSALGIVCGPSSSSKQLAKTFNGVQQRQTHVLSRVSDGNHALVRWSSEGSDRNDVSYKSYQLEKPKIPDKCTDTVRSEIADVSQSTDNCERLEVLDQSIKDQPVDMELRLSPNELPQPDLHPEEHFDILAAQPSPVILEEYIPPLMPPESIGLASYVQHSPTLQKLVELGVDLSKVEKRAKIGTALMKLDFEKDIQDKIVLLHRVGVSGEALARLLTINPFMLTEELVNLEARLEYLRSKMFTEEAISQVLTRAPYFISFSIERVDSKLGFYQKALSLTGYELRHIITIAPKLVTFKIQRIRENMFVLRRQLGFTSNEMKQLVVNQPRLLLRGKEKIISIFDYLHNHMGIPHKQMMNNPIAFSGRVFKLQERHQFLQGRGLAQYDPTKPGYVSLDSITKLPDEAFCQEIAKSTTQEYDGFLKSL